MAEPVFPWDRREHSVGRDAQASPEQLRMLCPRLPGSMEKSMPATALCAQVLVESHSGTGPPGRILLLGFANRTLHWSLVSAPRSSHLGLCDLSLQSSGWTSACVLS